MTLWILILSFFINTPAEENAQFCTLLENKIAAANAGTKAFDFDFSLLKDNDLIVFGEEHSASNPSSLIFVMNQLNGLWGDSKKCVLLELRKGLNKAEYISVIRSKAPFLRSASINLSLKDRLYYYELFKYYNSNGFKLYFVDHPDTIDPNRAPNHSVRNQFIAKHIHDLHRLKRCESSVLIVGKLHWSNTENTTIKDFLTTLPVTYVSLNFANAQEPETLPVKLNSWNRLCPTKPYNPENLIVFENSTIENLLIYPRRENSPLYGDFDFTLLSPTASF